MNHYVSGDDIDLDTEEVYDSQGRRIDEAYAEAAAEYGPEDVRPRPEWRLLPDIQAGGGTAVSVGALSIVLAILVVA